VVSQELIQLQGARNSIEAIGSAVGMTGGTSVGSIPSFATRGFTSNDITVMRDGIRQNTASQSSRPLDSFLFDRIEVLKGPASLLYGEGAVGGAINYVSKLPTPMFQGEGFASIGPWNTYRFGAGAGGPTGVDSLSYRIDASQSSSDGYVDRSDYDYTAIAGALRWDVSETSSLTLSSTYLKDETSSYYGTPVVYDAVIDQNGTQIVRKANTTTDRLVNARIVSGTETNNYNILDNFANAENTFSRLIWEQKLPGNWSLRNELYFATQRLTWRNVESTVWSPLSQLVERSSFFLIYRNDEEIGDRMDLVWNGKIGNRANKFLVGAIYDHNDQVRNSGQVYPGIPTPANVPLFGFDPGYGPNAVAQPTLRIGTDTVAVYVEDMFEATDALKLIAGLRYDKIDLDRRSYVGEPFFSTSYNPLTGRLGMVYSVTSDVNVYVSYSQAAQPVSQLVSLTASQADFSLQKGRQYEVGSKASFWDKKAELTVAVFDIEKNDLLTNIDVPGIGRVPSQIGAQVSQGTEIALALTPASDWLINANFAWTWDAEYKDFNENIGTTVISRNGNTPPNVPKIVAGLFVSKNFGAWVTTAGLRHVGERQANNNNGIQMAAYTTLDASIGYRWEKLLVTLRGRNLTDEAYSDWANASGLVQRLAEPISGELEVRLKF
jgi:iron complex outermembrane receptor protein